MTGLFASDCVSFLSMTCTRQTASARDTESLSAAAVSGVWTLGAVASFLPAAATPRCAFRALTGIPCLTCGTFRALRALMSGHWGDAFHLQPLLTVLAILSIAWVCYAVGGAQLGISRLRVRLTRREAVLSVAVGVTMILVNWVYLIRAGI